MSFQLNQAAVIFFVWVFCLLEDRWFDKLLRYQIEGQAKKSGSSASKAINFYNKTKYKFLWILLAFALTMILLSFRIEVLAVKVIIIILGTLACFTYVFFKLIPYNKSSELR